MSIELLELAAVTLEDLLGEVVFLGGATVTLWITDPGAPPVRPTKDVDVVVDVTTRSGLHDFEASLRERRFAEDQQAGVICHLPVVAFRLRPDPRRHARRREHPRLREPLAGCRPAARSRPDIALGCRHPRPLAATPAGHQA
ncbi:MAG: hypothetical protein ACR2H2_18960 [Solirubrobacteraceae bacterium]